MFSFGFSLLDLHFTDLDVNRCTTDVVPGKSKVLSLWMLSSFYIAYEGPVVQSIVSLMSSLRGQFAKCFTTL